MSADRSRFAADGAEWSRHEDSRRVEGAIVQETRSNASDRPPFNPSDSAFLCDATLPGRLVITS